MKARIYTNGLTNPHDTTVDALIAVYGAHFHISVEDAQTRDWLEGYALVSGYPIRTLLNGEHIPDSRGKVTVTFPELELHCDSTGDSP